MFDQSGFIALAVTLATLLLFVVVPITLAVLGFAPAHSSVVAP